LLSKFYQLNESTAHETLFVTAARISQMKESSFTMFGDISHTDLIDLRKRNKTVVVISSFHNNPNPMEREEKPMEPCIELFRKLFAKDMSWRSGISLKDGVPTEKLPVTIAIACLLNPMYGGTFFT
jgi:hypothetical protein